MIETVIILLLVFWILGLLAGEALGGFVHIFLLIALVIFAIRLLTRRKAI